MRVLIHNVQSGELRKVSHDYATIATSPVKVDDPRDGSKCGVYEQIYRRLIGEELIAYEAIFDELQTVRKFAYGENARSNDAIKALVFKEKKTRKDIESHAKEMLSELSSVRGQPTEAIQKLYEEYNGRLVNIANSKNVLNALDREKEIVDALIADGRAFRDNAKLEIVATKKREHLETRAAELQLMTDFNRIQEEAKVEAREKEEARIEAKAKSKKTTGKKLKKDTIEE